MERVNKFREVFNSLFDKGAFVRYDWLLRVKKYPSYKMSFIEKQEFALLLERFSIRSRYYIKMAIIKKNK